MIIKKIIYYIKKIPIIGEILVNAKAYFKTKTAAIQGINNIIINKGRFKSVSFDIIGNNNRIEIDAEVYIKNTLFYIRGNDHRILIRQNCSIGGGELWIEDNNGTLIINKDTSIEHAHLAVTEPFSILEIGKDCMLAKYVEIRTGDSHSILDMDTGLRINKAANVYLHDHVWIGAHSKILKGVTIGSNSVIGTASVVTKNIPSNAIAAGIPAKIIRENINWKRERIFD